MHHLDNRGDELLEHCCCFRGLEFKGRDVYLENRHMVTDVEVVHRNMFLNMYTSIGGVWNGYSQELGKTWPVVRRKKPCTDDTNVIRNS